MSRALVVYESMFGNTQTVARAVAEGLGGAVPVTVTEVGHAPDSIPVEVSLRRGRAHPRLRPEPVRDPP